MGEEEGVGGREREREIKEHKQKEKKCRAARNAKAKIRVIKIKYSNQVAKYSNLGRLARLRSELLGRGCSKRGHILREERYSQAGYSDV